MNDPSGSLATRGPATALLLVVLIVSVPSAAQISSDEEVHFVPKQQVREALANSGLMVDGENYRIIGAHRDAGPGSPEAHRDVTDIYYIVDGEATLVTGGRLEGADERTPGEYFGGELIGGEERTVSTGDVVAIPPGVPHWYKNVPNEISYYLVKVTRAQP